MQKPAVFDAHPEDPNRDPQNKECLSISFAAAADQGLNEAERWKWLFYMAEKIISKQGLAA
jgi:hypothetical protein